MGRIELKKLILIILVLILSLQVNTVEAKGPPGKVEIGGPGLEQPLEVTDPEILSAFSIYSFENIRQRSFKPRYVLEGYQITRYILQDSKLIAWDKLLYYPRAFGERGLIHYIGQIASGRTSYDGHWYLASEEGDRVMKELLGEELSEAQFLAQLLRDSPRFLQEGFIVSCRGKLSLLLSQF